MTKLRSMIVEAENWRLYHKARGSAGYIEALAASIRIRALKDALDAVKEDCE